MNVFLTYIKDFFRTVNSLLFVLTCIFAALLVFLNYRYSIEPKVLYHISNRLYRFGGFYLVYLIAFSIPYLLLYLIKGSAITDGKYLWILVLLAPAVFALKVNFTGAAEWISANVQGVMARYYAIIVNLPSKLLVVLLCLAGIWWIGRYELPFFGMTTKNMEWTPYFTMLIIMVPLIAWASTQADFLHTYPKLKQVAFIEHHVVKAWPYKLLYELAYGIDFITIELFFRGFLVLAFVRYAGQDAILPMAVFYCSIHFGKPLAECISSFFGGMILGIVVYHTKSIWGGLMIHLGIAWLMEGGAVIGNSFLKR